MTVKNKAITVNDYALTKEELGDTFIDCKCSMLKSLVGEWTQSKDGVSHSMMFHLRFTETPSRTMMARIMDLSRSAASVFYAEYFHQNNIAPHLTVFKAIPNDTVYQRRNGDSVEVVFAMNIYGSDDDLGRHIVTLANTMNHNSVDFLMAQELGVEKLERIMNARYLETGLMDFKTSVLDECGYRFQNFQLDHAGPNGPIVLTFAQHEVTSMSSIVSDKLRIVKQAYKSQREKSVIWMNNAGYTGENFVGHSWPRVLGTFEYRPIHVRLQPGFIL